MPRFSPMSACALAAALGLSLAACIEEPRRVATPPIYASLSSPAARVDAVAARNLINDYRRTFGLPPVEIDAALQGFAERQAAVLAAADRVDATRTTPLSQRLKQAGIPAAAALENVSAGYHSFSDAFSGWRGAPNHDATFRLKSAQRFGIATAYNGASKYKVYWVLVMAAPR